MRAIDWQRFLQDQREKHGKVIFTRTELANVSSLNLSSLKVSLPRLVNRGVIQRYTKGRYGLAGAVTAEGLVSSLDSAGYITGMYALYEHNLVTQAPTEITCFTTRRHNKSRVRITSIGRIVFICIEGSVYAYPENTSIAPPEQAFCDFVYLCRRRSIVPSDIVTFRNLERLDRHSLQKHLHRYPATTKREAERLILLACHEQVSKANASNGGGSGI